MKNHPATSSRWAAVPIIGGVMTGALFLLIACGAATTAPSQSPEGRRGTPACAVSPKDDACDICEAQKCCPEQTACEADSACKAADDRLDACEERSADAGHTALADCYAAFAATGAIGNKRAVCLRTNCARECL